MIKRSLCIFLSLLIALRGETLYVAQTAQGSDTGVSAAHAHSAAWFNTAANWGGGAGEIDPGDTVRLSGTITSTLTVQASGSSGNPITITYEGGAKNSKAYWGTSPNGAFYMNGKSHITIDGANAGIIENTANGTALANQELTNAISLDGGSDITIKRLIIRSMYVRTPTSQDTTGHDNVDIRGITVDGTGNLVIEDNEISDCKLGMNISLDGVTTPTEIRRNYLTRNSTYVQLGTGNTGTTGRVGVHHNTYRDGTAWDFLTGDLFHNDGIHLFTGSGAFTDVDIYNEDMNTNWGAHTTGGIFCEGNVQNYRIWSCFIRNTGGTFEAAVNLTFDPATGATIYLSNCTLVGMSSENTGGNGVYLNKLGVTGNFTLYMDNMVITKFYTALALPNSNPVGQIHNSHNSYFEITNIGGKYNPMSGDAAGSYTTLADWKTYLGGGSAESGSTTADPLFVGSGDYRFQSGSPLKDAGADVASPRNTTLLGNTRTPGSFDFGHAEYGEGAPTVYVPAKPRRGAAPVSCAPGF